MVPQVLLVDDEPEVIAAVQAALKREAFDVVGATTAREVFELLSARSFDVLIADEEMPEMKGSELLTRAGRDYPTIPRIMLSGRADIRAVMQAVNGAEIFRFLAKPVKARDLAAVIGEALALGRLAKVQQRVWHAAWQQHAALALLEGEPWVGSDSSRRQLRFVGFKPNAAAPSAPSLRPALLGPLSTREREVVQALASGKRVKEIARQFSISTHTVRNHLKAIYRKLQVRSQLELMRLISSKSGPDAAPT